MADPLQTNAEKADSGEESGGARFTDPLGTMKCLLLRPSVVQRVPLPMRKIEMQWTCVDNAYYAIHRTVTYY